MMATAGEQLRKAREERGMTLAEIAAATRINIIYLDRIENGLPLQLPPTYAQAFLKSYAKAVGLDPAKLLPPVQPPPPPVTGSVTEPLPPQEPAVSPPVHSRQMPVPIKQHQMRSLVILSAVILIGLVAAILFLQRQRSAEPVREVAFADVARERDTSVPVTRHDTGRTAVSAPLREAIDSLALEAVSVETVWVRVVIDSLVTREYTLAPQHRLSWKAARTFRVSVGDAAGIYFSLNGKHLGSLGPGKAPVKDVLLTRALLGPVADKQPTTKKPHEQNR